MQSVTYRRRDYLFAVRRKVVDGRWDFNGMTSDEVMDALRLCTGAGFENCDKCPLHDVYNCDDVLMQAAFELLQHHQFLIDEQEAVHGKQYPCAAGSGRPVTAGGDAG